MDLSRIRRLGVLVLVATVATVAITFAGTGMVAGAAPPADLSGVDSSVEQSSIESTLENATGEVEIIIVLEPPPIEDVVYAAQPEAVLKSHADSVSAPIEALAAETEAITIEGDNWLTPSVTVTVDTDDYPLDDLAQQTNVVALEDANALVHQLSETTTDDAPQSSHHTYGLEQINAPDAWDEFDTRGEGVSIAILDTGIDGDHPDLTVSKWRDFDDDPSDDPMDYGDHGTHVAGTAVGGDASGDHIGVAPDASLYMGAVLTDCDDTGCSGPRSVVVDGMEWAVDEEADIISLSLGGDGYSESYLQATQHAHAAGTTVIAATGNDGDGTAFTPGNIYSLISVGATDEAENVASFSSGMEIDTEDAWGDDAPDDWPDTYIVPDVSAPGSDVYSSVPGGSYDTKSGTSMATPHVTGVVALMQSVTDYHLSPDQAMSVLTDTAHHPDDGEQDTRYGHGIVDAYAALDTLVETGVIEGTITDTVTGEPIDGATVTVEAEDGTTYTRTTGTAGGYHVDSLPTTQTYTVSVQRSGYHGASQADQSVEDGQVTVVDLDIEGDADIEVTVAEAGFGGLIEGGSVEASGPYGTYDAVEQGDGVYHIDSVPSVGSHTVSASATGYQTGSTSLSVDTSGQTATTTVSLDGDATIEATVTDAISGGDIEGVSFEVERDDGRSMTAEATDEEGQLSIAVPGIDATYTVTATREGYDDNSTTATLASGESVDRLFELTGDAEIEVTVTDGAFETTVSDAEVNASGSFGTYPGIADGDQFVIEHVPSIGSYEVFADADGYHWNATTTSVTTSGETATAAVSLSGDASVNLSVEDGVGGAPIDGVTFRVERDDGATMGTDETDQNGSLEVALPGTGATYTLTADRSGYEELLFSSTLTSGETDHRTVELIGDSTIEVSLDDVFDTPVEAATVKASGPYGFYPGVEDDAGTYVIEAVPSVGTHTITASAAGYVDSTTETTLAISGMTASEHLSLEGDATLDATITDGVTDVPLPEVAFRIERDDGAIYEVPTSTDDAGSLTVSLPGTGEDYAVHLSRAGYHNASASIIPSSGDVVEFTRTLTGDGALDVTIEDGAFEAPIEGATVTASGQFGTYEASEDDDGYTVSQLPSVGSYTIDVAASGYEATSAVVMVDESGAVVTRTIALDGDATLSATFADAVTEAAISDAHLAIEREDGATMTSDVSDGDGSLAVALAGTGDTYTVRAVAEGYESTSTTVTLETGDQAAHAFDLVGAATINVTVRDALFHTTIETATVVVEGAGGTYPGSHETDGHYHVPSVPATGTVQIVSTAEGYQVASMDHAVTHAGMHSTSQHLSGDATLEVTVVDAAGDPVEGAQISLVNPAGERGYLSNVTDAEGVLVGSVPGINESFIVHGDAERYTRGEGETGLIGPGGSVSITIEVTSISSIPGFGFGVVALAALGFIAYGLVRRRR